MSATKVFLVGLMGINEIVRLCVALNITYWLSQFYCNLYLAVKVVSEYWGIVRTVVLVIHLLDLSIGLEMAKIRAIPNFSPASDRHRTGRWAMPQVLLNFVTGFSL